ncbi:4-hydroxy-tetrahydrodipicolinate reductase [Candidatus Woesearchaeota archaeon]|nr:4-hydroxy-tetrahydrodipicolinate reductase [Candidatus Woesearchaeota archaeon]
MNIAIVGYGGMGKIIAQEARKKGMIIVSIIDPKVEGATHKIVSSESLKGVDVAIDFTSPGVALENIKKYVAYKTDVVMGTTGWYDHMDEVKEMVKDSGIKFLWASNFSIGVNLYFKIIDFASKLMDSAEEYDIWGNEVHHKNKKDSPSGTAKSISKIILKNIERKNKVAYEMLNRKIDPDEFHFSSTRGGEVNFEHTIGFDSPADTITIRHNARNRNGYASGSIHAAEWLNKKEPGYYELDDFMKELGEKR